MDKKKKKAAKTVLFSALAAAAVLSGCSGKSSSEVQTIQESGVLRVALVDTGSRYTSLENGTPVGVEPELSEVFAEALGVTVQFQVTDRETALSALDAGEADIAMGCINSTAGLAADYLTSTPYGKGFLYAVTRRGDFALTAGAFENSVLGVPENLDEESKAGLYETDGVTAKSCGTVGEAAQAIKDGTIRAYICYEGQARELLEDEKLQVQNVSNLDAEEFVVAVPKTSQTLLNGIDTLIRQFLEEG